MATDKHYVNKMVRKELHNSSTLRFVKARIKRAKKADKRMARLTYQTVLSDLTDLYRQHYEHPSEDTKYNIDRYLKDTMSRF